MDGEKTEQLHHVIFRGGIIILHLDSPCYLSNNLLFLCQISTKQIVHHSTMSAIYANARTVLYIIYCLNLKYLPLYFVLCVLL